MMRSLTRLGLAEPKKTSREFVRPCETSPNHAKSMKTSAENIGTICVCIVGP